MLQKALLIGAGLIMGTVGTCFAFGYKFGNANCRSTTNDDKETLESYEHIVENREKVDAIRAKMNVLQERMEATIKSMEETESLLHQQEPVTSELSTPSTMRRTPCDIILPNAGIALGL